MSGWTIELPLKPGRVYLVTSDESALACVDALERWQRDGALVAIDTEATGLEMFSSSWRLRTVQFSDAVEAWVVPADWRWLISFGLRSLRRGVAHNRTYDLLALECAGYEAEVERLWSVVGDSSAVAHLLDSRPKGVGPGIGLTALAKSRLGTHAPAEAEESLKTWCRENRVKVADRYERVPLEVLAPYAGLDVLVTRRLADTLGSELYQIPRQRELYEFELEVQRAASAMTRRGFRLDREYAGRLWQHYERRSERLAEELEDQWEILNPASGRQVADALVEAGVVLVDKTPSGQWAVGREVLSTLDHPIAELVTEYRNATKFAATYVEPCLSASSSDGRVHAAIRTLGARTARMSISSPPLQQLPAGDSLVRRMFVADEGMAVCAVDFAQVELRVLAALAQEPAMVSAIRAGEDLHSATAEKVGVDRKIAKMTNFLVVYGGGARALASQAGISQREARAAIDGFFAAYPRVRAYADRVQRETDFGAEPLVTVSGRRLRLDRDRSFAAVNYSVQSVARDLFASRMLEVLERVPRAELLLPVHDELVFQAPEAEAEELVAEVVAAMSTDFLGVPIEADGEIFGPSWGHGYGREFESVEAGAGAAW